MDIIDEKLDRGAVDVLLADKLSKQEVTELLPNMDAYENKVQSRIEDNIDILWQRLEEKLMAWDNRMITIRQEFDMVALTKNIETKANKESVSNDFKNHEFKIQTLDQNILTIATDFETFQQAINRMH